ncbi:MAG: HigA family addiction module antitoxin [Terriglobales bacterium]
MPAKLNPVHPGEILREEFMAPLGLSQNRLAAALRVPTPRIGEIVNCRRAITTDTALRLARFFTTTPEFWMNLQTRHDLVLATRQEGSAVQREVRPVHELAHLRPAVRTAALSGARPAARPATAGHPRVTGRTPRPAQLRTPAPSGSSPRHPSVRQRDR